VAPPPNLPSPGWFKSVNIASRRLKPGTSAGKNIGNIIENKHESVTTGVISRGL
jgi:hypothetical protein